MNAQKILVRVDLLQETILNTEKNHEAWKYLGF